MCSEVRNLRKPCPWATLHLTQPPREVPWAATRSKPQASCHRTGWSGEDTPRTGRGRPTQVRGLMWEVSTPVREALDSPACPLLGAVKQGWKRRKEGEL